MAEVTLNSGLMK